MDFTHTVLLRKKKRALSSPWALGEEDAAASNSITTHGLLNALNKGTQYDAMQQVPISCTYSNRIIFS
jgi:hypothetical protein